MNETAIDIGEQQRIRREKLAALQAAGRDPFQINTYNVTHSSQEILANFDKLEGTEVGIAGRLMQKRVMGKASFVHIQDGAGKIQVYIKTGEVSAECYDEFKSYDIGDILGIRGTVFRTQKDEVSVRAAEVVLLSKCLHVLPEKYHGLKDTEARYRGRYVDLIVNPETRDTFIKRTAIMKGIRAFLDSRGYLEVDTPVLQTIAGGTTARPFLTHHNTLDIDMYLRIALELPLKRLIVGGFERVYELGRCFRNEGMSPRHNPEFVMLELYRAYTDLDGMMELTESMLRELAQNVCGTGVIPYGELEINFEQPFAQITMTEAVKKYSGVDFSQIKDTPAAKEIAKQHGVHYEARHEKGDILAAFFDKFAEHHLLQPTFLTEYPVEISPLAKRIPSNPEFVERFELFIGGREIANAFTELNDPIDQRARFTQQEAMRTAGDDEAHQMDEDFLTAVEYGMPPTGGMGMGIERVIMLLTNQPSIRDVIFFPTMKPVSGSPV